MRRSNLAIAAAVVACGGTNAPVKPVKAPPTTAVHADAGVADAAQPRPDPPIVSRGPLRAPIYSPPAGEITAIAATADARAAITSDQLGGLRLWPALDGSREPVVVELPRAREVTIAVGDAPDTYVVAVLDEVGGLVVATIDAGGRTLAHSSLSPEPPFVGVVAVEHGAIAWRADSTILLLGPGGVQRAHLAPDPGERVIEVAASGGVAVAALDCEGILTGSAAPGRCASIEDPGHHHEVRLIDARDGKLAWGNVIHATLDGNLAISPSGTRVAASLPGNAPGNPTAAYHVHVVDLAGALLFDGDVPNATFTGFTEDDVVVATGAGVDTSWIPFGKKITRTHLDGASHLASAATTGALLRSAGSDLAVLTPDGTEYLGYELATPQASEPGPGGTLMTTSGGSLQLLDARLATIAGSATEIAGARNIAAVRWLGGTLWLAEAVSVSGIASLTVVDTADRSQVVATARLPVVAPLRREGDLVTLSYGLAPSVMRFDRSTKALVAVETGVTSAGQQHGPVVVAPLAPDLARGSRLVSFQVADKLTITWFRDDAAKDATATITVMGAYAGIDRAGHAFVWERTPATRTVPSQLQLAIYQDGTEIARIATPRSINLAPEPAGTRFVESGPWGLAVYKLDGTEIWHHDMDASGEVSWLDDGALALVTPGGIVRFDAATGAVQATKCGWNLTRSAKPHPVTRQGPTVCMQVAR